MIFANEKKVEINIVTYIILTIMIIVLLNDYLSFIFNIKYVIGILISSFIVLVLEFLLRKKIKIKHSFKKEDIIFYVFLFGLMILTIPYPDRAFDTFNYHLYLQEKPFGDKLFYDFFAGKNINSFSYAFPDRVFYIFRYLLGYRLGVILNYILIIGIFYNVKSILKKLDVKCNDVVLTIVSMMITFSLSIIDIVDSYYIDLISLYLLIELFNLMIMGSKLNNNKETNLKIFSIIGLLYGLTFATKISNAVLLVLYFILYIIKNRNIFKLLTIKNITYTLLLFMFGFILYFVYNIAETGNPVFPFYNTIFKSNFFGLWDWLDTRFGPHTIIETLLWPLIILKYPNRLVDTAIAEPLWCYGYIISIIYVIYYVYRYIRYKETNNTRLFYFISTILIYLVWAKFQLGYSRYGLIVLVLGGISTYIFVTDMFKYKKNIVIGILLVLLIYNYNYSIIKYLGEENFWIFNNYYNNSDDYMYNVKNIFAKGNDDLDLSIFEENSAWLIFYYNSGYAKILNGNIPIITATSGVENEYTRKLYNDTIEKYDHLYTLVDALDFQNFIENLNNTQFKIKDIKQVISSDIIGTESSFTYIFEVEKCEKYCENSFFSINTDYNEKIAEKYECSIMIGIPKDSNQLYTEDYYLEVNGETVKIDASGDLVKVEIEDRIDIEYQNDEGIHNSWYMVYKNIEEK